MIGSKCVWKSRCDWSTHSAASWESYSIFTCEIVWKISGLNLVWNFSYMKFFIHEIGVNFLSGMFNLVPHVKFLICIHFKHVSGVNQVWNRPDLMRIFCTGTLEIIIEEVLWSIRGSYQTIWSSPLTNAKWHSEAWPCTITWTSSIDQILTKLWPHYRSWPFIELPEVSIEHLLLV